MSTMDASFEEPIFINYVSEPSFLVESVYRTSFIGKDDKTVSIASSADGRRIGSVGVSQIRDVSRDIETRKGGKKPSNYMKSMAFKNLSGKHFYIPAATHGDVYETTTLCIAEILYNCKILEPNGSRNYVKGSSITCSPDGITTMMLPVGLMNHVQTFRDPESPQSKNLLKKMKAAGKMAGTPLNPSHTSMFEGDLVPVDVYVEAKSPYSRCLNNKKSALPKPIYTHQCMIGAEKVKMELAILFECDIKECTHEQFGFNRDHLGPPVNYKEMCYSRCDNGVCTMEVEKFTDEQRTKYSGQTKFDNISSYQENVQLLGAKLYFIKNDCVKKDNWISRRVDEESWKPYERKGCSFDTDPSKSDIFTTDLPVLIQSDGLLEDGSYSVVMLEFNHVNRTVEALTQAGYTDLIEKFHVMYSEFLYELRPYNYSSEEDIETGMKVLGVYSEDDFSDIADIYLKYLNDLEDEFELEVVGAHPWKEMYSKSTAYPGIPDLISRMGLEPYCKHFVDFMQSLADMPYETDEDLSVLKEFCDGYTLYKPPAKTGRMSGKAISTKAV